MVAYPECLAAGIHCHSDRSCSGHSCQQVRLTPAGNPNTTRNMCSNVVFVKCTWILLYVDWIEDDMYEGRTARSRYLKLNLLFPEMDRSLRSLFHHWPRCTSRHRACFLPDNHDSHMTLNYQATHTINFDLLIIIILTWAVNNVLLTESSQLATC